MVKSHHALSLICLFMTNKKIFQEEKIQLFLKGYKTTNVEGFVAIDQVGKAVKLVDRLEFSQNNFNAAKAWDK